MFDVSVIREMCTVYLCWMIYAPMVPKYFVSVDLLDIFLLTWHYRFCEESGFWLCEHYFLTPSLLFVIFIYLRLRHASDYETDLISRVHQALA